MKKFIVLLLALCIFMPVSFAEWRQIAEGTYMDNMSIDGNTVTISYKYTKDSGAFKQLMADNKKVNYSNISAYTVDLYVDCTTKKSKLYNMKLYDWSDNVIMEDDTEQWSEGNANSFRALCNVVAQRNARR